MKYRSTRRGTRCSSVDGARQGCSGCPRRVCVACSIGCIVGRICGTCPGLQRTLALDEADAAGVALCHAFTWRE